MNDKPMHVERDMTLAALVAQEEIPGAGTAVAVNTTVIRKVNWDTYFLNENDQVLVISAAYGG